MTNVADLNGIRKIWYYLHVAAVGLIILGLVTLIANILLEDSSGTRKFFSILFSFIFYIPVALFIIFLIYKTTKASLNGRFISKFLALISDIVIVAVGAIVIDEFKDSPMGNTLAPFFVPALLLLFPVLTILTLFIVSDPLEKEFVNH